MAFRLPTLRHTLRQPSLSPRLPQRRWAQVQDVRFLATHDTEARILAKYKAKLEEKAKAQGLKDLEQLKEQYKDKIEELRKQAIVPGATGLLTPPPTPTSSPTPSTSPPPTNPSHKPTPKSPWPSPPPPPPPQQPNTTPAPPPGIKTLSSYLDLPKIQPLPEKEIQALWRLRHASNPQSIHFSLPAQTFSSLLRTAKQHPSFVLPVPREIPREDAADGAVVGAGGGGHGEMQQAAELHYLQFTHPHVDTTTLMFTTLAEFKLRGEFASPHTTITFHQELAASHGLVLGQGLVIEGRGVSVDDARWLVMCMQKFYVQSEGNKERGELLSMFTRGDSAFTVETLIDEAEKIL
ncbi:F1F0 ATP synthase assembly protein-like protein Atp11 [Plenodomus tracheiphilus IPT5]|uniref:F1F0 ATP synthase assembly protein-like protein Atp11 n=1 Tax=Plenodomus tracheiphilus IPT5 TaxID=1408161 RepID=A0A6A7ASH0_9PLEO|nr:F1F0 ATP synthase assembly protein-like protein Atp11 [Plenodomus tracheiphilus IPT5]